MRSCPSGGTERCINPKILSLPDWMGEASLDNIDFHLRSESPARGTGTNIPGQETDFDGVSRPRTGPSDIGAYQGVH
jgi:hypothetical protein